VALATPAHAAQAPDPPATADASDPPPSGQDEAIRQFRAARELYSAGAYAAAARGFEASYAAAASPEAAYNAALAHDKVGDDLATMRWYRRYLATASPEDPSYPQAQQRALELRARLGELRLQVDSTDEIREIRVNGEAVTLSDFPKLVPPGHVELRLIGAGPGETADIPAEVAPGGTWTVQFTGFARPEAPEPVVPRPTTRVVRPDPTPVPPAPRVRPLTALFWTGTGLTTASAIAMGVLGGLVLRQRAVHEDCGRTGTCTDTAGSFRRYRDATNVMVGVTAGLAVITLALGIAALRDRRKAGRERVRITLSGLQLAF
ncbi:MAG TPA: hypothetical protein VGB85_29135, partial [Nannocystis sp.]